MPSCDLVLSQRAHVQESSSFRPIWNFNTLVYLTNTRAGSRLCHLFVSPHVSCFFFLFFFLLNFFIYANIFFFFQSLWPVCISTKERERGSKTSLTGIMEFIVPRRKPEKKKKKKKKSMDTTHLLHSFLPLFLFIYLFIFFIPFFFLFLVVLSSFGC